VTKQGSSRQPDSRCQTSRRAFAWRLGSPLQRPALRCPATLPSLLDAAPAARDHVLPAAGDGQHPPVWPADQPDGRRERHPAGGARLEPEPGARPPSAAAAQAKGSSYPLQLRPDRQAGADGEPSDFLFLQPTQYDFRYEDSDTLMQEINEFFSYAETEHLGGKRTAFEASFGGSSSSRTRLLQSWKALSVD
jgi:hypothetical protein